MRAKRNARMPLLLLLLLQACKYLRNTHTSLRVWWLEVSQLTFGKIAFNNLNLKNDLSGGDSDF